MSNVLGIIAEYNPFHNGHAYQLMESKKTCDADVVVCVMSGNFMQRGAPAIVDKWSRAQMALEGGVDIELADVGLESGDLLLGLVHVAAFLA